VTKLSLGFDFERRGSVDELNLYVYEQRSETELSDSNLVLSPPPISRHFSRGTYIYVVG